MGSPKETKFVYDGLPFRGPAPMLKDNDTERRTPQLNYDSHVKIFNLKNKEHLKEYEEIVRKITSGQAVLSTEEREYDQDEKNWRIFIVYSDLYYNMPDLNEQEIR